MEFTVESMETPALTKANLADAVYSLDDIGRHIAEACL